MEVEVGRSNISEQLEYLFDPRTVAVIGASNTKMKWGYIVPANILAGGYTGEFYPVNPHDEEILDHRVYRSVKDLSLIHISEPTRLGMISYAVFCLKKKKKQK